MLGAMREHLAKELDAIREKGLYKRERVIETKQGVTVGVAGGQVLNLCANNYLGLAQSPEVAAAAKDALDRWGYGLASVRFICGTQTIHRDLEQKISSFLGTEETILYSSCWDANGGLFEILLNEQDAVISDELNHASIIDGVRLCKAQRFRYKNNDMADLEAKLIEAKSARFRMIATDGVFSMDGSVVNLKAVCDLADKYNAVVMVDDSHAVGVLGEKGRGTPEFCGVQGRVDILTGTLGKALGGASGGYVSASRDIVDMLRQRSRPYLFSNTVAPAVVAGAIKAIEIVKRSTELKDRLHANAKFFREGMTKAGFTLLPGEHPIIPIMLGDAVVAQKMADAMLKRGVYVIGFFFPVVAQGKARIRTQMTAAHTQQDLAFAIEQFAAVKKELAL